MCGPTILAARIGQALSFAGAAIGAIGKLSAGRDMQQTEQENAARLERTRRIEQQLTSIEDERTRQEFREEMARQDAELAARGVSLDSPTAAAFADAAGREMEFASRSVRQAGNARAAELSHEARLAQARGRKGMLTSQISVASDILSAAPDLWPGLKQRPVLQ